MKHDFRRFYNWFKKFLKKHIGENIDDVFALFCKVQPEFVDGQNIREEFWDLFRQKGTWDPGVWYGYGRFYLDGKTLCFEPINKLRQKKHKDILLSTDKEPIYKVNSKVLGKLLELPGIHEFLYNYIGKQAFYDLCNAVNDIISASLYRKIDGIRWKLYDLVKGRSDYFYLIRDSLVYIDHKTSSIEYGTPEYRREMWNRKDKTKKSVREFKKDRERFNSELLGKIEAERKREEQLENDTKIKKHGFSKSESFRGEEYHGQKRKKKKK
jgi:hypothetical protein